NIQKTICIHLATDGNNVKIDHILKNNCLWSVKFAGWGLSMLAKMGKAVIPLPKTIPFPEALLPNHAVVVWPYTNLEDERIKFSNQYITIEQNPEAKLPIKLGADCRKNWIGYFLDNYLFIKKFIYDKKGEYPDYGSCVEIYTNSDMLELETLSPIQTIEPGEVLIHREEWELWKTDGVPANDQKISSEIQRFLG
ncbi:MAG: DUF4380 domain-containing protein, partial [Anaerolineaceae bacterium]|nr:DUF4380 domain-containing protein [Anaerolineaceae bacterium]